MCRFTHFSNVGSPSSEICSVHVWIIHENYLVVFIAVQNLVGIDAAVTILYMF